MNTKISPPERSALFSGENETIWHKRLDLFLRAEYIMKRFQLIFALSLGICLLSITFLGFGLFSAQIITAVPFTLALLTTLISAFMATFFKPLVRLSRSHRNDLSRRFYQNHIRVEFQDNAILLRNIRNSQIIIYRSRHG
ncbi:hypothetical protein [Vibrio quintilis]|uniref:Uncharacterized protein n=1 Tax=Vibrio quintilis TaxID=1117707 RepID=A0A1M7YY09_9VIBR|nr:hypothetical protein [Vibrio quintilis]SHO57508.1 hypothetical protein VQ7734_03278 [Vibrio quintilis]